LSLPSTEGVAWQGRTGWRWWWWWWWWCWC